MAADGIITTKRCTKCSETKPTCDFPFRAKSKDGLHPWCRECKNADGRAYHERNLDKERARNRAYNAAKPEKGRARQRAYYRRDPARSIAAVRRHEARNPDKRARWARTSYERHREKLLSGNRARWQRNKVRYGVAAARWRAANKRLLAAHSRNYKARKRNAPGTHTAADITRIYAQQKGRCAYCRVSLRRGFHVDHITPLSAGGSNFPSNLHLTCEHCNLSKKDRSPLVFARSLGKLL